MNQIAVIERVGDTFVIKSLLGRECAGGMESQNLFQMILDGWDNPHEVIAAKNKMLVEKDLCIGRAQEMIAIMEKRRAQG